MLASSIFLVVIFVLLVRVMHWSSGFEKNTTKSGARLPKGSFGWPIIGESLALGWHPIRFTSSRVQRYGSVFKSSIFFRPTILGASAEFCKFVGTNPAVFASGYTSNVSDLLGRGSFLFKDGPLHLAIKKPIQKFLGPENLRNAVGPLDDIIRGNLASWADKGTIVTIDGTRKITLATALYIAAGDRDLLETAEGELFQERVAQLSRALNCVPINIPGSTYNKGKKAKEFLSAYFKNLIQKRKGEVNAQNDVLGAFLAARENPEIGADMLKDLGDDEVADTVRSVLFGAYDTTSASLLWTVKLLRDYPDVFEAVRAEQEEILRSRESKDVGLTWEDLKKMVYTTKYIWEVQRYASVPMAVFRKPTRDLEFQGNLIPKDWSVMVMMNALHWDPVTFPEPSKFDPSRFDVTPKPYTFIPFSFGPHMCPGMELAKMIMLIFIHNLVTKFRFEEINSEQELEFNCLPIPKGGYPIKIERK